MTEHPNAAPYIVFGKPDIQDADVQEVVDCLRSGWLGTGPRVARFEQNFAAYKGVTSSNAAAVNSCTAALHIAMVAAGLSKGAEVITTPLTFCATVNAIIHAGLKPVLADIDPRTQCIDPKAIEAAISPRTEAILPVHFAGRACDMNSIMKIADRHNLIVIEDCAHAIETQYRGKPAGTFGDFGCFSFYVTKNLATGEGGMILGKDSAKIARAKILALHGMSKDAWHRFSDNGYKHYQVVAGGFKYNMMDLQAALGIHQLERVEANWSVRKKIWGQYDAKFADLDVRTPASWPTYIRHAYHLYNIVLNENGPRVNRDQLMLRLHEQGIGTGVHYLPVPEHQFYQHEFGWNPDDWPHAKHVGGNTISLPLSVSLSKNEIERIIEAFPVALAAAQEV